MKKKSTASLLIAGCARDCAVHLAETISFIEKLAAAFHDSQVIVVENDSTDNTRIILQEWERENNSVKVIVEDGLSSKIPSRTERISYARNLYLDHINHYYIKTHSILVVVDMDGPVNDEVEISAVVRAIEYLNDNPNIAAAFANSFPVYYDIWALRHPSWCPGDCWQEYGELQKTLGIQQAVHVAINSRQIPLRSDQAVIPVQSAFGGLAIYKTAFIRDARYCGVSHDGVSISEHVPFNLSISNRGQLIIIPSMIARAPLEHIITGSNQTRNLEINIDGNEASLLAPADHMLDKFQARHPLYDRRLPVLASILGEQLSDGCIIDVGSNIGDTAAAIRLSGCRMPIMAVEASSYFIRFAEVNRKNNPKLLENVDFIWALAGSEIPEGELVTASGTGRIHQSNTAKEKRDNFCSPKSKSLSEIASGRKISLIKTDTDGFDQYILRGDAKFLNAHKPIIWSEAQTSSPIDENDWLILLKSMSEGWPRVVCFDNFGLCFAVGDTAKKADAIVEFLSYCRRQRDAEGLGCGSVKTYYADIVLFPEWAEVTSNLFLGQLVELQVRKENLVVWRSKTYSRFIKRWLTVIRGGR